jgi:transcriptional regulator with XRE-family HTH domain
MANNVSDALKKFFKDERVTQQQIADKLGVTQAAVGALLNGKPFGKKNAKKWGEAFKIQPSWLLTGEGEMLQRNANKNEDKANYEIEVMRVRVEELEERIKEKDAQIKEKDAQIKEKDAQISKLLAILAKQS